ncbi:MAG: disulfide bond formation protein DsbA [Desulfarculus sp.]|nr:MAG: disulfide bond formation protein DsbA [Desulfarculus sp.]
MDREQLRALLKQNPKLVLEVLAQEKVALYELVAEGERIKQQQRWLQSIEQGLRNPLKPTLEPGRPWQGRQQAPLIVVEYSDFLCPSCAVGAENVARLLEKHPDKFRLLLKHSPASDLGQRIAIYFEAIGRQSPGKAWQFYHRVFQDQRRVQKQGLSAVQQIAAGLGLDKARLAKDLADPALNQRVQQDLDEGAGFNLDGTPSYIVAGVVVRGAAPVSAFEEILAGWQKLNKAGGR